MLKMKQLDSQQWVAPQLRPEDAQAIAEAGVKTVVCHRPDGELHEPHLMHESILDALAEFNIELIYQPIEQLSYPAVTDYKAIIEGCAKPVLSYCTTGTRSTVLWALMEVMENARDKTEIIVAAGQAGYGIAQYLPEHD
ncbi:beta-lactamase hydrolase domain-containing protein [Ostreibacterium oceani]|uniref:Beta-lactamase hydrolase-like protein phosphatase-like domain-containing protein n=1 Tax=Ostreibacterium oceani TaxID=2654998 RepID=A0A6N7F1K1_9GAMM|nr:sulfur transferase domain-containing protein [Ostreibacterium oceani]MPV85736.1 hypothetical protein [Ostreibacterium oceani]